jgi:uncharacterized protein YqjF (DUF2071 family)
MPTRKFLTAEWRDLAMLNFEVEPDVLVPRVPAGAEIDFWNGRCYVSLVGFRFLRTKVMGVSIPFHRDFDEVNLRFYVRREVDGQVRRGVVFVKEIVPRLAIAQVARWVYNESYVALPMRHEVGVASARYEWRYRGKWNSLSVETRGDGTIPEEGSEAAFIAEHYWGYTTQRDGTTLEYQVEHPSWRVAKAQRAELVCDVDQLYGAEFGPSLSREPTSAFLADGSAVLVRRGVPLTRTQAA